MRDVRLPCVVQMLVAAMHSQQFCEPATKRGPFLMLTSHGLRRYPAFMAAWEPCRLLAVEHQKKGTRSNPSDLATLTKLSTPASPSQGGSAHWTGRCCILLASTVTDQLQAEPAEVVATFADNRVHHQIYTAREHSTAPPHTGVRACQRSALAQPWRVVLCDVRVLNCMQDY